MTGKKQKKITIDAIAEAAGVSRSTVSLVLNNKKTISDKTQRKVLDVCRELGYSPAKPLMRNSTGRLNIGLIEIHNVHGSLKDLDEHYSTSQIIPVFDEDVTRGVESIILELGCGLLVSSHFIGTNEIVKDLPPIITEGWVDGVLLLGGSFNEAFIQKIENTGMPYVYTGSHSLKNMTDCVYADVSQGAFDAVEYLITMGHERIAIINGPKTTHTSSEKMKGYLLALQRNGIALDQNLVEAGDFSSLSGYEAMKRLLEKNDRIDAVFVGFDGMSVGVKEAVEEKGLSIPEDISIVGFEDSWIATHFSPPLTTVRVAKYEIGQLAARLLIERIKSKKPTRPTKTTIPTELVIRKTCKPRIRR